MSERAKILHFTIALEELISANIPLNDALKELSESDFIGKEIRLACKEILESLLCGNIFSNAISECKAIRFDESYVAFVSCAEETGNLEKIFSYLKNSRKKNADFISDFKTILIYPAMIFALLASFTVALFFYGEKFFFMLPFENNLSGDFSKKIMSGCLFSLIFTFVVFGIGARCVASIFLCELKDCVFSSLSILTQTGVSLERALDCAIRIATLSPKTEFFLLEILENARNGLRFSSISNENRALDSYAMMIFSVGVKTSSLKNAFSNISNHYEKKTERYKSLFMRFLEPVLICVAAIYLVILFLNMISAGV